MKKISRLLALSLAFVMLLGSTAFAADPWLKDFEVRGGVQFGMHWSEVVEIEAAHGFQPSGSVPYASKSSPEYQINYMDNIRVGTVDCFRIEYDFHTSDSRLFQFYYVVSRVGESGFSYFSNALTGIYGAPAYKSQDNTTKPPLETDRFSEISDFDHWSEWVVAYDDGYLVIDLWLLDSGSLFCCYNYVSPEEYARRMPGSLQMTEQESIDYGL